MSDIPAPESLTRVISQRALQIAQLTGPRKTGRGLSSLTSTYQQGIVGMEVPEDTSYMIEVENGIQAHPMNDLAGRVIPIRGSDGTISFRTASAKKIGTVPIINRASSDGRIRNDNPEWTYPNKPGVAFMKNSINKSINEWKNSASPSQMIDMLMQTELKDVLSQILFGRNI